MATITNTKFHLSFVILSLVLVDQDYLLAETAPARKSLVFHTFLIHMILTYVCNKLHFLDTWFLIYFDPFIRKWLPHELFSLTVHTHSSMHPLL